MNVWPFDLSEFSSSQAGQNEIVEIFFFFSKIYIHLFESEDRWQGENKYVFKSNLTPQSVIFSH